MRAIDTNIVVRFLTGDDRTQADTARLLLGEGDIHVSLTVLLESEWVLRSAYGFSADRVTAALRDFAGLPGVAVEDAPRLAVALDWAAQGLDFADALHLAGAAGCTAFISFDRKLAKAAGDLGAIKVIAP